MVACPLSDLARTGLKTIVVMAGGCALQTSPHVDLPQLHHETAAHFRTHLIHQKMKPASSTPRGWLVSVPELPNTKPGVESVA